MSTRKPRRTEVPVISIYIRQEGVEVDQSARTHIRRKLRTKLAKFAASVERASVRIGDLNGPRGGIDHVCRIKVVLSGLPSVVYERRGASTRVSGGGCSRRGGAGRAAEGAAQAHDTRQKRKARTTCLRYLNQEGSRNMSLKVTIDASVYASRAFNRLDLACAAA